MEILPLFVKYTKTLISSGRFWIISTSFLCLSFLLSCSEKENESFPPPNILILMADDVSFPHMGAYGTSWVNTPTFDRIAQEGLLFMNAYTPNAKCAPSRANFLTGRNSWQLEEAANHWNNFPEKFKTFMEALSEQGYFTGHTRKGWSPGNPGQINGQPRLLTGKAYNSKTLEPPTTQISSTDYAENFRDFLNERTSGQPFCFWYGSIEPHRAYEFGSSLRFGRKTAEIDQVPGFWPDVDSVRIDLLDYAYELEYFDAQAGKMLDMLEELGELDNTLIIITADNGMPFPRAKGQSYEYSNHLPLAIMWKNGIKNPGRKIEDFISFIDMAPTVLEASQITESTHGMQIIEGKSFIDIFQTDKDGLINPKRDHVLIGKERHDVGRPNDVGYPMRGMVKGNYLLVKNYETDRWPAGNPETGYLNTDGGATKSVILNLRRRGENQHYWDLNFGKRMEVELYDISKDKDCLKNLAHNPEYRAVKESMIQQMEAALRRQEDPRMLGRGHIFDEYPYVNPNDVGFYEKWLKGETPNAGWVNESDFEKEPVVD
ncbi:sulfatase family protein [Pararhodonellum marinum]|uniref:sulfatase family protein n=1 Tax=Pararhodonellum marinum TaxID=2755358 RepID=UPI00188E9969|nr:sulfatase [Pararhodonellum marinum]